MSNIKLSDYVIKFLHKIGIKHIFVISGGGNIHLIEAVGKNPDIQYICNHHEQASATAAEAYARITGNIGVCLVTTGPGGTNAITGMLGAWLDSIPMLVISGQVKREMIGAGKLGRQYGDQEINIIDIIKPVTKYAVTVMKPNEIGYHLEKAVHIAKSGRPGPVWIDIPLDVQGSIIEEKNLKTYKINKNTLTHITNKAVLRKLVKQMITQLQKSERPVLYAGIGIRLAGAVKEFLQLVNILKIPVLTSYAGYDLIPSDHPYFYGRAHAFGQRAANFILQNSDFLLSIGARLDIRTIGYTYKAFARQAYHVMVDIDKKELEKPILSPELPIQADAKDFILEMIHYLKEHPIKTSYDEWLLYGKNLNAKYPVVLPEYWKEKKFVNPYCFIETIGKQFKEGELIVVSNGVGPLNCSYQALFIKKGQRIILNNGCAQMGYGLPAAIGVSFAAGLKKRVICFEGDGSLQLNIHELQVMKHHNLPIKIFVYSNDGYQSIVNTQKNLFEGRFTAVNSSSGVSCPDFVKIGKAYRIKSIRINNHKDMAKKIKYVLDYPGGILCDINAVRDLMLSPKLIAKKLPNGQFVSPPLEDMGPFLPREEFKKNMIIPLWEQ